MHWCPVPSMNGTGPYCCYCNRGGACLAIDMAYISRPKSYIFVRLSAPHAFLGQLPAEGRLRPAGQPAPPGRVWAASPPYGRLRRPALRASSPHRGSSTPAKKRPLPEPLFFYSLLNSVSRRPSLRSSAHWMFHSLAKSSRLLPFRSCTHLVSLVSVMVLGSASRLAIHRIYP